MTKVNVNGGRRQNRLIEKTLFSGKAEGFRTILYLKRLNPQRGILIKDYLS